MEPHPRERINRTFHWLEWERMEKGINIKSNQNLAKGERREICQKINASIVMNMGTMPIIFHRKMKEKGPWRSST